MDSVSQIALGAAIGVAVMGRRTAVWKAALWGAVAGTLPDLDVLIDHGDPIRNMVLHRAQTHALFWLTLFSLPFAAAVARLQGEWPAWKRWWLALWLALVTHPLLDTLTVYGTQLALPLTDHPFGVGSVFIIDPLYTVPLLVGTASALAWHKDRRGRVANIIGLALSTAYLGWGMVAQQQAARVAQASLAAQGIFAERVLVTPTAFNSVLWRVVAMSGDSYHEGFYSLLDATPSVRFDRFARGTALAGAIANDEGAQRIASFSQGFYKVDEDDAGRVRITDLRMGQEPAYTFSFAVAQWRAGSLVPLEAPLLVGGRPNVQRVLSWQWQRALGHPLPPPR
ncbi:metal-dependent hydrolase [Variovorax ginsengisoli]|uniref:Inner membrane protein n=1 Tax=Variovorax ginsengisoli TaxID=363844 RepID=A0ABT9SGM8_9BURK|nr:metal-dependent hydrolase [Variovorax ginsengisoli]MDP9902567.1 inner membrane protein [Variovorax ginsengisoli]